MQLPLQLHLSELKFRIGYVLLSYTLSLLVILKYNESIFLLETYAFICLNSKKFIATHITEVFFTSIYIASSLSWIINFPYAYYNCRFFLATSWYKSQVWIFSRLILPSFLVYFLSLLTCYFVALPSIFIFLDSWKITLNYALKIQLEARIETYTHWTLQTAFFMSSVLCILFSKLLHSYLLDNMITLHIYTRRFKKYLLVLFCLLTSFTMPPEGLLQIILIIILTLLVEVLFFITCIFFAKNNV
uniref:SecY-independent transporter protein n=1 Tax=Porphyra purpurea TaxID=2787 RepID=O99992_PORPU|nr:SecY-independent transporter protein [Porphyra purpurea]AAD03120.1 SecY-independent transporter protein [Porphyra purpurea]